MEARSFFDKVHYHGQCSDLVGEGDHESPAGGVGDVRLHIEILVHVDEREWEVRWGCFFLDRLLKEVDRSRCRS